MNPVCGKGISIERCTNGIVETMTELGIDNYEIYTTKAPRDGYEYAKKEVEKGEHIRVYAFVGEKIVSEAEFMAQIVKNK